MIIFNVYILNLSTEIQAASFEYHHVSSTDRRVNRNNLIDIPLEKKRDQTGPASTGNIIKVASFNAQSLGPTCKLKRAAVYDFISEHDIDFLFIQESWFKEKGDEGKLKELAPAGYSARSFPRSHHGGGLAVVFRDSLSTYLTWTTTFSFSHLSFECVQVTLSLPKKKVNLWNIYRTHPSQKNKLKDDIFFSEFQDLLDSINNDPNSPSIFYGDFNFHFDNLNHPSTVKILDILDLFDYSQFIDEITHTKGHIIDWVLARKSENVIIDSCVSRDLSSDHFAIISRLNLTIPKQIQKTITFRKIKAIDKEKFSADLATHITQDSTLRSSSQM